MEVEEYTDTPPEVVGMVFALKNLNFSIRKSQEQIEEWGFRISHTTIWRLFNRFDSGTMVNDRSNCGRTPIIGEKSKKKIVDFVLTNRFTTAADIYRNKDLNTHDLTSQTIRNVLKDEGLKAFKPVIVNCINEGNKQKRKDWCKQRLKWKVKDWEKVVFTDESLIQASSFQIKWVRKYEGEILDEDNCITKSKWNNNIRITVWGGITHLGPQSLKRKIEDWMSKTEYPLSKSTIQRYTTLITNCNTKYEPIVHRREGHKACTEKDKNKMINEVNNNPEVSLRIIANDNNLNPDNLPSEEHFKRRRIHRQKKFWSSVWFTDESKLFAKRKGKDLIWIHESQQKNEKKFLKEEEKWNGGLEIQVFGAISQEVLNTQSGQVNVIQGNCTQQLEHSRFFGQNEINLISWSPKGADLNPIEKVWAEIKGQLYQLKDTIHSRQDIWEISQEIFFSDKIITMCKNFYISQHKKIEELKSIEGERLSLK
ncbi:hypothetical protein ABPG72_020137 [Tetrahymena utriculariae]